MILRSAIKSGVSSGNMRAKKTGHRKNDNPLIMTPYGYNIGNAIDYGIEDKQKEIPYFHFDAFQLHSESR